MAGVPPPLRYANRAAGVARRDLQIPSTRRPDVPLCLRWHLDVPMSVADCRTRSEHLRSVVLLGRRRAVTDPRSDILPRAVRDLA